jgi:lysophospholipase L1-like esterase
MTEVRGRSQLVEKSWVIAVASLLALAACAADSGIAPHTRLSTLDGEEDEAESEDPEDLGTEPEDLGTEPEDLGVTPANRSAAIPDPQGTSATEAATFTRYIAFGDSFVAGVGASNVTWQPCGTSPQAWPKLVHKQLGISTPIIFPACSGATTQDVVATGGLKMASQMSQLPPPEQLDSALITIAIGGNDVKLDERIKKCMDSSSSKNVSSSLTTSGCADLVQLLNNAGDVIDEALAPSLDYTFRALRAAAPNATIVAVGYPHLAVYKDPANAACDKTLTGFALNRANRLKLAQLVDAMNNQIKVAAANAGIQAIVDEVVTEFDGHEACSGSEWIVGADAALKTLNRGVAHPNDAGHRGYATAVLNGLSKVKARSAVVDGSAPAPADGITPADGTTPADGITPADGTTPAPGATPSSSPSLPGSASTPGAESGLDADSAGTEAQSGEEEAAGVEGESGVEADEAEAAGAEEADVANGDAEGFGEEADAAQDGSGFDEESGLGDEADAEAQAEAEAEAQAEAEAEARAEAEAGEDEQDDGDSSDDDESSSEEEYF